MQYCRTERVYSVRDVIHMDLFELLPAIEEQSLWPKLLMFFT